jgi:hypothetical protein
VAVWAEGVGVYEQAVPRFRVIGNILSFPRKRDDASVVLKQQAALIAWTSAFREASKPAARSRPEPSPSKKFEGAERCGLQRLSVSRPIGRASLRSAPLRRFPYGAGPRFSWSVPERSPSPSAELPAGDPIVAGRSPHAAPARGCEPCAEAPAASRISRRLAKAPSNGNDK